jgi:aerobic carbon-monoxide dehydrogenase small subunit
MSSTVESDQHEATRQVRVTVNGREHEREVPVRTLLSDFIRHDLGLTGTHVGCEHGVCGACTVQIDGRSARSCLTFAVQCDGAEIRTVESLASPDGELHPLQEAFRECHALQCGFCTSGFLLAGEAFLRENPRSDHTEEEIREAISGNLCRCTGYSNIVDAVQLASERMYGRQEG